MACSVLNRAVEDLNNEFYNRDNGHFAEKEALEIAREFASINNQYQVATGHSGLKAPGQIGRRNQQIVSNFTVTILRFAEIRLAFVSNSICVPSMSKSSAS